MSDRPSFSREPRSDRDFDRKDNNRDDRRPSGDRPSGDRPSGDRFKRDDNRRTDSRDDRGGDRPRRDDRGERRDDRGGDRNRDDRPRRDDRSRDDRDRRPSGDRTGGDRPSGDRFKRDDRGSDRPGGDRPSGDRFKRDDRGGDRSRDDRPKRDDRNRDDRPKREDRGERRDDRGGDRSRDDRFKRDDRGGDRFKREDRGERRDDRGGDRPGGDRFKRDDRSREDRGGDRNRDDRFKRDDRGGDRSREDRKPGRRFEGDRRDFQRDDKNDFRRDRDRNDSRGDARGDAPRKGVMDLIREADVEILRMLARRTRLREKLSERQAGAKERDLRTSWEEAAARVSRDPRLLRDMFTLLQQIEVNAPDVDAPQAFTLAPAMEPVRIDLPVPASTRQTRLRMALAAGAGAPLVLGNALLNSEVVACLKMFNCAGASLRWEENPDRVECAATSPICGITLPALDKVIYVGDDPFNFYLMLFQLLARPSRVKFMGESTLRFLDISPLRRFLTVLGARLTSVVPGEDGLPARMESSAILPDNITVPADIPADAVIALLAATPFWASAVRVDLEARPDVNLGEVLPLLRACGCAVEDTGVTLTITPPARLVMPEGTDMDLLAAFPLLAFAGCTGGASTVRGHWPKEHPCGPAALTLLRGISSVDISEDAITATGLAADTDTAPDHDLSTLPAELLGPALALYLLRCRHLDSPALPLLPAGYDDELVDGFLAVLGYIRSEDSLTKTEPVRVPWAAPSAWWGMGLVLASFFVPKLRLANPAIITTLLPQFWGMFNALPEPSLERPKTEADAPMVEEPRRRRVLAEYMPESEMPPAIEYDED